KVVEKLTAGKTIFGIENQSITEGNKANLSLFTTNNDWDFSKDSILSKSKNSAFIGQKMKGKAIGIYNQKKLVL
ncbi:MAG TPA: dihydroorotase, partial [Flavobacterium sp.]|nr:dihydroorotase [Flavobacterium sp.]